MIGIVNIIISAVAIYVQGHFGQILSEAPTRAHGVGARNSLAVTISTGIPKHKDRAQ